MVSLRLRGIIIVLALLCACQELSLWAQRIVRKPFVHAKSHPTVTLDSISFGRSRTVLYLHLINKIPDGWFCLSSDIRLRDSRGIEWQSIQTKGLPTCPKTRRFRAVGVSHAFEIHFPEISSIHGPLTLYERCDQHCLHLEGIVIDAALNRELYQLEEALTYIRRGRDTTALELLLRLFRQSQYPQSDHILQCAYHLTQLYRKLHQPEKAHPYIQYLKSSDHPRARFYLQKLQKIQPQPH